MFDAYVRDFALLTPRAPAVITPHHRVSYSEFDADIDRLGRGLAGLGIGPATGVVAVACDDPYLQYLVIAALARLGVASSPGHDTASDLRLTDSAPDAETDGRFARVVHLSRAELAAMRAAPCDPLPRLELDPLAIGRVMMSSGTTRAPRRVGLTWRRLADGNHATLHTYGAAKAGTWVPTTSVDSMLGLALLLGAWTVGGAVTNGLDIERFPNWFETLEPGVIAATPNTLRRMLNLMPVGQAPRPAWRLVSGGGLLPVPLAREIRLRITPDLMISYGATEAGIIGSANAQMLETPGCVGVAAAGAIVEIVDEDGRPVARGEAGEVRVRGERKVAGYLGDPEATAERFRGGWFHTGDAGRLLPDGRLIIEGRIDDRMNLGGVKFMPNVLEEAAAECPGVLDAAAFAAPDNKGFDQCWLAVVTQPGFDRDSLATHLARYRGLPPNRFAWTDAIPRNAMGKVERNKLRDALLAVIRTGAG